MSVSKFYLGISVIITVLSSSVFSMDQKLDSPGLLDETLGEGAMHELLPETNLPQDSMDAFFPPNITIAHYINTIAVGGSIEGWGHVRGDVRAWIQSATRLKWVPNWMDFPFFKLTCFPNVDGNRLRCDYVLPYTFGDSGKDEAPPSLSLFRRVTSKEIGVAKSLPKERQTQRDLRFRKFKKSVTRMMSEIVPSSLFKELELKVKVLDFQNIMIEGGQKNWYHTIKADLLDKGNKKSLCYLNIEGMKLTYLSKIFPDVKEAFDPYQDSLVERPIGDLFLGHSADVFYEDNNFEFKNDPISLSHLFLDINGQLRFVINNKIKLESVLIMPVGNITILLKNYDYPIKKIRIIPANSSKPMFISANIKLTENPRIMIECLNAARIEFKFRKI